MKSKNEKRPAGPGWASAWSGRGRMKGAPWRSGYSLWEGVSAGRVLVVPAFLFFQLLGFAFEAEAVGGISNSKVNVLSADTVARNHIELEPYFSAEFLDDRDDTFRFGGGLRVTPGLLDYLEAGVSINYLDVEDSDLIETRHDFGDVEAGEKLKL